MAQPADGAQPDQPASGATTPVTDIADRRRSQALDREKLETIIRELSEIRVATHGTPVRISLAEKKDIEDFIYITLRKQGLEGKAVSHAKLLRYALRYVMKVHEAEFVAALTAALKKEERLSI